jgi:hypothetical protein
VPPAVTGGPHVHVPELGLAADVEGTEAPMSESQEERETRELAEQLFFRLEPQDSGYSLKREVDVDQPVKHENISLAEAKEILNTWKLRGFHGG